MYYFSGNLTLLFSWYGQCTDLLLIITLIGFSYIVHTATWYAKVQILYFLNTSDLLDMWEFINTRKCQYFEMYSSLLL